MGHQSKLPPFPVADVRLVCMFLVLLPLLSCDGSSTTATEVCDPAVDAECAPLPPPPPPNEAPCGSIPVPANRTCTRWSAANGAITHTARDTFDILVIDAGTEVRVAAGVSLAARRLLINGTAAAPVRFLPLAAGERWGGLVLAGNVSDTSFLRHVHIEYATRGINAVPHGSVSPHLVLEDSHIQDISGVGVFTFFGTIARTSIDGAGPAGILIGSNSHARITDVTIRNGTGHGIELTCIRCYAFIGGGSIENNAGDGILASSSGSVQSPSVIFEAPIRITGNGGRPLVVPLSSLQGLMSDSAAQRLLLGNGADSIIAATGSSWGTDSITPGPIAVHAFLPMRIVVHCLTQLPIMTLEAGASLDVTGTCAGFWLRLPDLNGTDEQPVTINGAVTGIGVTFHVPQQSTDTARVRYARIRGLKLVVSDQPTLIEHVRFDSARIVLLAAGSRLDHVSLVGGGRWGAFSSEQEPAITVAADVHLSNTRIEGSLHHAVHVTAGSARMSDCSIHGGAAHGILVEQGTAHVEWCNLHDNAGYAIHNATPDTVHAPNVWWGDPAGPRGPDGDNIDGPIRISPVLTAPHPLATGPISTPNAPTHSALHTRTSRLVHTRPWKTTPEPVDSVLRNIEKL